MITSIERQTMKKVYLRLLPFCFVLYFICYLDRVNIGFAALTMNKDLGFSAYLFGLGAGAFYGGYCLFEVPSNLTLEKVGARFWLARIMITWGLFSGAMAFVSGPISFVTLRFLLGAAEAGFFPGILFYFLLVSGAPSRADDLLVHGGHPDLGGTRRSNFDRATGARRDIWPRRVAMGVPRRGSSRRDPWFCIADLPQRPAGSRLLADYRRKGMDHERTRTRKA